MNFLNEFFINPLALEEDRMPFSPHHFPTPCILEFLNGYDLLAQDDYMDYFADENKHVCLPWEDCLGIRVTSGCVMLEKNTQNMVGVSVGGGAPNCPCIYVVQIFDGSPACKEGSLKAGDEIVGINGLSVKGRTKAEVARLIQQSQQQVTINFNKLHADPKQGKTLDIVLKKFKHKMAENMSANTADSFGMSRAILCNDTMIPKLKGLQKKVENYKKLKRVVKRYISSLDLMAASYREFGDLFATIGARDPQINASKVFSRFGDSHREFEKNIRKAVKLIKPMLEDLNVFLTKAIPDMQMTVNKYLNCKFEYLSYCLKVKELDDEESSSQALDEYLYRVETGNYEYRLLLRCRQEAKVAFSKMRNDVTEKLSLLENKHVQGRIFQLQRLICSLATMHNDNHNVLAGNILFPIEIDFLKGVYNYNTSGVFNEQDDGDGDRDVGDGGGGDDGGGDKNNGYDDDDDDDGYEEINLEENDDEGEDGEDKNDKDESKDAQSGNGSDNSKSDDDNKEDCDGNEKEISKTTDKEIKEFFNMNERNILSDAVEQVKTPQDDQLLQSIFNPPTQSPSTQLTQSPSTQLTQSPSTQPSTINHQLIKSSSFQASSTEQAPSFGIALLGGIDDDNGTLDHDNADDLIECCIEGDEVKIQRNTCDGVKKENDVMNGDDDDNLIDIGDVLVKTKVVDSSKDGGDVGDNEVLKDLIKWGDEWKNDGENKNLIGGNNMKNNKNVVEKMVLKTEDDVKQKKSEFNDEMSNLETNGNKSVQDLVTHYPFGDKPPTELDLRDIFATPTSLTSGAFSCFDELSASATTTNCLPSNTTPLPNSLSTNASSKTATTNIHFFFDRSSTTTTSTLKPKSLYQTTSTLSPTKSSPPSPMLPGSLAPMISRTNTKPPALLTNSSKKTTGLYKNLEGLFQTADNTPTYQSFNDFFKQSSNYSTFHDSNISCTSNAHPDYNNTSTINLTTISTQSPNNINKLGTFSCMNTTNNNILGQLNNTISLNTTRLLNTTTTTTTTTPNPQKSTTKTNLQNSTTNPFNKSILPNLNNYHNDPYSLNNTTNKVNNQKLSELLLNNETTNTHIRGTQNTTTNQRVQAPPTKQPLPHQLFPQNYIEEQINILKNTTKQIQQQNTSDNTSKLSTTAPHDTTQEKSKDLLYEFYEKDLPAKRTAFNEIMDLLGVRNNTNNNNSNNNKEPNDDIQEESDNRSDHNNNSNNDGHNVVNE